MSDDFVHTSGNLDYVNKWLKLIALVFLVMSLLLCFALVIKIVEGRQELVIPIVINEATGDAFAVDYRVIDATGEQRSPVEVRKFCLDFLAEAYTFNRYTARTHLDTLANYAADSALGQIRENLDLPRRSELINRNAQGLFELTSFMITETSPAIKTQIYFRTKIYDADGRVIEETGQLAVMTIRPIRRSVRNPHGLIVIEYRQSPFNNPG